MNKKPAFFGLLFLISLIAQTQPEIVWQKCYGTSYSDYFSDAILTSDGGFLASAFYEGTDGDAEGQDSILLPAILMKFDADLNLSWQKNFGGTTGTNSFFKIHEMADGFVCAGITLATDGDFADNNGGADIMLLKTDLEGTLLWSHCYGSPNDDSFRSVIPLSNGNYILTGATNHSGGDIPFHYGDAMSGDAFVMKIDSMGELLWTKVLGGSSYDGPLANPVELPNGLIQIHIYSASDDFDLEGSGVTDIQKRWIIEINDSGEIINESFMSAEDDFERADGELILMENKTMVVGTGNAESVLFPPPSGHASEEGAIAQFDTSLQMVYMKQWGGSSDERLYRYTTDAGGNFYFIGVSRSQDYDLPGNYNDGINYDYWLLKTDSIYNKVWSLNFGGSANAGELGGGIFNGTIVTVESLLYFFGKCVVPDVLPDFDINCGHINTLPGLDYDTDAWMVAFDLTTNVDYLNPPSEAITITPNPATGFITLKCENSFYNVTLDFYDITGRLVDTRQYDNLLNTTLPVKDFHNGLYLVNILENGRFVSSSKLIIQH